eukprot:TCONS_00009681-protein
MSESPTPSCDDYITTEELFQSFMDVALIAEQEINNPENGEIIQTNNEITQTNNIKRSVKNHTYAEISFPPKTDTKPSETHNNNEVLMPLPLMVKTSDPIYECVAEQPQLLATPDYPQFSDTNKDDGTIVTVSASPTKKTSLPTPDYPGADDNDIVTTPIHNDYESVIQPPIRLVTDIYAKVDKHKTTEVHNDISVSPNLLHRQSGSNESIEIIHRPASRSSSNSSLVPHSPPSRTSSISSQVGHLPASRTTSSGSQIGHLPASRTSSSNSQTQYLPGSRTNSSASQIGHLPASRTNSSNGSINHNPASRTSSTTSKVHIPARRENSFGDAQPLSKGDTYETIISISSSPPTPVTEIETKFSPLSEYAIIHTKGEEEEQEPDTCTYESVDDLKLDLRKQGLDIPTPSDGELSPEVIAFGFRSQRLHTEGQAQLYQSCLNTIDRSARNSDKKKHHFFGFGKKHQDVIEIKPEEKTASMNRKDTSIPCLCSGYLFKQGGTGITPKNWRLRWFELKKDNCLYYYKNEQDPTPAGAVILTKYQVTRAVEANKRFSFKLTKGGARTYYFAANSEDEMKKWMKNLGEAVTIAMSDQSSIPECSLKNVSVPATSIMEPDCHGFLWKQGNFHKSWRRRYCVLKYGCLFYYEEITDQSAIGVFKLHNYTIAHFDMKDSNKHGIQAVPPGRKMRTYFFYAESEIDWKRWMEALKHSIQVKKPPVGS